MFLVIFNTYISMSWSTTYITSVLAKYMYLSSLGFVNLDDIVFAFDLILIGWLV